MAKRSTVIVTGVKEIDRNLAKLPDRVRNRVVKRSIRVGLYTLFPKIKQNIHVLTGALRQALKVRVVKTKRRGDIALEIQLNSGTHEGGFSPAFAEFGTKHQQADPVMIPVFNEGAGAARDITMRSLLAGVLREVAILGGASPAKALSAAQEAKSFASGGDGTRRPRGPDNRRRDSKGRFIGSGG